MPELYVDGKKYLISNRLTRGTGTWIASLPLRVTGRKPNRGDIAMAQGHPEASSGQFTGLFWNRDSAPAMAYQRKGSHSRYRCYDKASKGSKTADSPLAVPWILVPEPFTAKRVVTRKDDFPGYGTTHD